LTRGIGIRLYSEIQDLFLDYGEYLFYQKADGKALFFPTLNINVPAHYFRTIISESFKKFYRANWKNYISDHEDISNFNKSIIELRQ